MKNGEYELIIPPEDYPGPLYRGRYALEHRVVWWENTGHVPRPDEDVHHKNENKRQNEFENLELIKHADHTSQHNSTGRTMVNLICPNCQIPFIAERKNTHLVKKQQSKPTCCSRSCAVLYTHKKRVCNSVVE